MLNADTISTLGKYLIALAVLIGAFVTVTNNPSNSDSAWGVIGLIVGWIVRDSAGSSATSNAIKIAAASTPPAPPVGPSSTPA